MPGLPAPCPEIVMDGTGVYWRRISDPIDGGWLYGMLPVSDNPDPIIGPLAVYRHIAFEEADGSLSLDQREASVARRNTAYAHIASLVRAGASTADVDDHLVRIGFVLSIAPTEEASNVDA